MNQFREPPPTSPLIMCLGATIIAVDPETGAYRWERKLDNGANKVLVSGSRMFLCTDRSVVCCELDSGHLIGRVDLPYLIRTALLRGDRLYVAGAEGASCLTSDGFLLWEVKVAADQRLFKGKWVFTANDHNGAELWSVRGDQWVDRSAIGLVLDGQVAQPDVVG